jgi:predicted site-specific integrase-resolvase
MQQQIATYKPEWIKEADACTWLGVNRNTLIRWRSTLGLAFTNINGKTVMYDRKQIEKILNENSTYAFDKDLKLAV